MKKKVEAVLLIISIIFILCIFCYHNPINNLEEISTIFDNIIIQKEEYYKYAKDISSLEHFYSDCELDDEIYTEFSIESSSQFLIWGTVNVKYSKACYRNRELTYGASSVPATLSVKKKKGHWIITDYYEQP